jgi:uncharacterized membrane protein
MLKTDSVVAVYQNHEQAEKSIAELQDAGVSLKSLSIAAKETHKEEDAVGYYNTGDRMQCCGKIGVYWESIWGVLSGSAMFAIPGLGPILVAGPLVSWIVAGLQGAVIVEGLTALGAALTSIGISKDSVIEYETALETGNFLLVVHGMTDEVAKARGVLDSDGYHIAYTSHGERVMAR